MLNAVAELKRTERAEVESERIKVDNDLDQLTLECENIHEEVREVEKKVVVLNEQADELRDVSGAILLYVLTPIIWLNRLPSKNRWLAMQRQLGWRGNWPTRAQQHYRAGWA